MLERDKRYTLNKKEKLVVKKLAEGRKQGINVSHSILGFSVR